MKHDYLCELEYTSNTKEKYTVVTTAGLKSLTDVNSLKQPQNSQIMGRNGSLGGAPFHFHCSFPAFLPNTRPTVAHSRGSMLSYWIFILVALLDCGFTLSFSIFGGRQLARAVFNTRAVTHDQQDSPPVVHHYEQDTKELSRAVRWVDR